MNYNEYLISIILNYANNSFNNPKNLKDFIANNFVATNSLPESYIRLLMEVTEAILVLVNDPEKHKAIMKKKSEEFKKYLTFDSHVVTLQDIYLSALKCWYGYRSGKSISPCVCVLRDVHDERLRLFGDKIQDYINFSCYECDRQLFIHFLSEISNGEKYDDIKDFYNFIAMSEEYVIVSRVHQFKNAQKNINSDLPTDKSNNLPLTFKYNIFQSWRIRQILLSICVYALSEFLMHNNPQKIKKCSYCQNFFIATRLRKDQKYCSACSGKNKMTKEERAKYMVGYRKEQKKREEKEKKRRLEKEISKLIAQGINPKDAQELAILKKRR